MTMRKQGERVRLGENWKVPSIEKESWRQLCWTARS